jgi:hypothetical protein
MATPALPMYNPFSGNYFAEADVYQYHAVLPGTAENQVNAFAGTEVTGDGTIIAGVAQYDQLTDHVVGVVYFGITWGYAIGAVTRNDMVEAVYNATVDGTNPGGGFQTVASGVLAAGTMVAGIALETAANLEKFKVFLTRHILP